MTDQIQEQLPGLPPVHPSQLLPLRTPREVAQDIALWAIWNGHIRSGGGHPVRGWAAGSGAVQGRPELPSERGGLLMSRAGTEIRQTWEIQDGHLMLTIKTHKPMDGASIALLEDLVDDIETFVYTYKAQPEPEAAS